MRPIGGPLGVRLRRAYYRRRFKACGSNLTIDTGVSFEAPQLISAGDWLWIDKNVVIIAGAANAAGDVTYIDNPDCAAGPGEVIIGDNTHVAIGCVIQGHGGVSIGPACTIGSGSMIYSLSNAVRSARTGPVVVEGSSLGRVASPVAIGRNVWLGLNSIVIGHSIGDDCFLKPMTVVVSHLAPNTVASGNPARPEGLRYPDPSQ